MNYIILEYGAWHNPECVVSKKEYKEIIQYTDKNGGKYPIVQETFRETKCVGVNN